MVDRFMVFAPFCKPAFIDMRMAESGFPRLIVATDGHLAKPESGEIFGADHPLILAVGNAVFLKIILKQGTHRIFDRVGKNLRSVDIIQVFHQLGDESQIVMGVHGYGMAVSKIREQNEKESIESIAAPVDTSDVGSSASAE